MIASIDRTDSLVLDVTDFNRAMGWLLEAERYMPLVFQVGSIAPDSRVIDEVVHFIKQHKGAVPEHQIINFLRERVGSQLIKPIMDTMMGSKSIVCRDVDKTGQRKFTVG
jgi:hypothetical protein